GVIGDYVNPYTTRDDFFLPSSSGGISFGEQPGPSVPLITAQCFCTKPSIGIGAIGVVCTGGLTLSTPPGYSDVNAANNEAGDPCRALTLAQISENAAL